MSDLLRPESKNLSVPIPYLSKLSEILQSKLKLIKMNKQTQFMTQIWRRSQLQDDTKELSYHIFFCKFELT